MVGLGGVLQPWRGDAGFPTDLRRPRFRLSRPRSGGIAQRFKDSPPALHRFPARLADLGETAPYPSIREERAGAGPAPDRASIRAAPGGKGASRGAGVFALRVERLHPE